jgi:hypothetical protein
LNELDDQLAVTDPAARSEARTSSFYALGLEAEGLRLREQVRQFYRALGATKEWAENNYYKLPIAQQNAELIPINAFWRDFAAWNGRHRFSRSISRRRAGISPK